MRALDRFESQPDEPGVRVYRISALLAGSAKYGPCEVCKAHVSEAHIQSEALTYLRTARQAKRHGGQRIGAFDQGSLIGHRECLLGARRGDT